MTPSPSIASPTYARTSAASQQSAAANQAAEIAIARMVSETADDLRSPLTIVREAIRLVGQGNLGAVNDDQQSCLAAAVDQCNCMDQMIGEMVQLERLRMGSSRANRSWVEVGSIRAAADEALRSWAEPRKIDVLWDMGDDPTRVVFADPAMLRRLVVNLATNAIRASRDGSVVLIRLQRIHADETIRWSVVDQGIGMSERDIHEIAHHQRSAWELEGVGLSMCRQLAAMHFSSLQMRSRLGYGTEVSFQTPALGPRSVASAWSRWRVAARGPLQKPQRRSGAHAAPSTVRQMDGDARVRLDPPSVAIDLSYEAGKPRCEDRFAAGTVTLGAAVSRQAAEQFDRLLQSQLAMFEFAYRSETRRWVWVFDVDTHGVENRIAMISDEAKSLSEKGSDPLRRGQKPNEIDSPPKGQTPFRIGASPENGWSMDPMEFPKVGRVASVDYGTVRIGIAICDPDRILASPLEVYPAKDWQEKGGDYFRKLIREERIAAFVVGLPIHCDGGESEKSKEARTFAKWLADETDLPVRLFDERFTTSAAQSRMAGAGLTRAKKKKTVDAIAALVLLESFLESCRYHGEIVGEPPTAIAGGGEGLDDE
jgi:putative transcription antitermination factor YqgF